MDAFEDSTEHKEPQYITEDCPTCSGSGFSGRGTGYDDVCECGGYGEIIVGIR